MTRTQSMRRLIWAGLLMVMGLQSSFGASPIDDSKPQQLDVVVGVIKAVDPANETFILTLILEKDEPVKVAQEEFKLSYDQKTKFWLDGKPVTMDDALIVGHSAMVTHMNGVALKVKVKSKPA